MPRKSYDALNNELSRCRRLIKTLSTDSDYGITTRHAAQYELGAMTDQGYIPAFITLVSFKGHIEMLTSKIKRICFHRDPNIAMIVRLSAREILFFTERDPSELMVALQQSITKEEMRANIAYLPLSNDFKSDARSLQAIIMAKMNGYSA